MTTPNRGGRAPLSVPASEQELRRMLGATSGGTMLAADLLQTFHRFAERPVTGIVDEDGDLLLAEYGTEDGPAGAQFTVSLTRQYILDDEDESMHQLHAVLAWPANAQTERLGSGSHWSDESGREGFADAVRGLDGWAWALKDSTPPGSLHVELEQV